MERTIYLYPSGLGSSTVIAKIPGNDGGMREGFNIDFSIENRKYPTIDNRNCRNCPYISICKYIPDPDYTSIEYIELGYSYRFLRFCKRVENQWNNDENFAHEDYLICPERGSIENISPMFKEVVSFLKENEKILEPERLKEKVLSILNNYESGDQSFEVGKDGKVTTSIKSLTDYYNDLIDCGDLEYALNVFFIPTTTNICEILTTSLSTSREREETEEELKEVNLAKTKLELMNKMHKRLSTIPTTKESCVEYLRNEFNKLLSEANKTLRYMKDYDKDKENTPIHTNLQEKVDDEYKYIPKKFLIRSQRYLKEEDISLYLKGRKIN